MVQILPEVILRINFCHLLVCNFYKLDGPSGVRSFCLVLCMVFFLIVPKTFYTFVSASPLQASLIWGNFVLITPQSNLLSWQLRNPRVFLQRIVGKFARFSLNCFWTLFSHHNVILVFVMNHFEASKSNN